MANFGGKNLCIILREVRYKGSGENFHFYYPNVLKVLGHPKIINFPFVPNGKFIIFRCPKIWANYSLIIMCSNTGTPNNHHFLFGTNGKVVVLGVPILKHFRVYFA